MLLVADAKLWFAIILSSTGMQTSPGTCSELKYHLSSALAPDLSICHSSVVSWKSLFCIFPSPSVAYQLSSLDFRGLMMIAAF